MKCQPIKKSKLCHMMKLGQGRSTIHSNHITMTKTTDIDILKFFTGLLLDNASFVDLVYLVFLGDFVDLVYFADFIIHIHNFIS